MKPEQEEEIFQSLSVVLNALKHGGLTTLCAVLANILKTNMQQKKRIQWLENQLKIQNSNTEDGCEPDYVFRCSSLEELPHIKNNLKSIHTHTNKEVDADNMETLKSYSAIKTEHVEKQESYSTLSQSDTKENDEFKLLDNVTAPHPLLGCICDICQKLISIPNIEVYKIRLRRTDRLFPINCIVKLKNGHIGTISYVGHQRNYRGLVSEKFCQIRRPLGVTIYIWQQDNKEEFVSLKEVEYIFEEPRPFLPEIKPTFHPSKPLSNPGHGQSWERREAEEKSQVSATNFTSANNHVGTDPQPTYHVAEKNNTCFHQSPTLCKREGRPNPSVHTFGQRRRSLHCDCGERASADHIYPKQRKSSLPDPRVMKEAFNSFIEWFEAQPLSSDPLDSGISLGLESADRGGGCCGTRGISSQSHRLDGHYPELTHFDRFSDGGRLGY